MKGQEAILEATRKGRRGETLDQVYARYQKTTDSPILSSSVLVALTKLIDKGCVERVSEGRYRATGVSYSSAKGQNRPESIYVKAIRELGPKPIDIKQIMAHIFKGVTAHNKRRKPDQKARRRPEMLSALTYLNLLKMKGRVTQNKQGKFGLPFNKK